MHRDVDDGDLVIDRMAARRLRRKFFSAVETAAKLCLNPLQREAFAAMNRLVKLPASHETSVSLALRPKPLDTLAPKPGSPHRVTHDRKSVWLGLEGGVGLDRRLNIASQVASAIAKVDQPNRVTEIRSESEMRDLTSYLLQERDRGQGFHLLVGNNANTDLDPALLDWLDEIGLRVVALAGCDDSFFLIAEARLVGKINAVVEEFSTRAPWKDIDASA
ncbi:hypothetical protein DBR42_27670 [Pelomonas sp. HMWF004]|nr:hypothetical protein DBR42_27670 [Pelomonas sp. HMWF004]